MAQIQVRADELPNYIGSEVSDHGVLKKASVVYPGGDIVVAEFGEGFSRREATFPPGQIVSVETE